MDENVVISPRKRRRQSNHGQPPTDAWQRQLEKQKLDHPAQPPPSFWDNLSEIPLTRSALRELDRRNHESARLAGGSSHKPGCHPVTGRPTEAKQRLHAADCLSRCTPKSLGLIKRIARQGGPDLSGLRGYPEPSTALTEGMSQSSLGRRKQGSASPLKNMSASNTEGTKSTKNTKRTKSTGPYDRAFQQHLIDHGIYPDLYQYPDGRATPQPENIEEIREVLRQPRPSLSPSRFSEDDFFHFRQAAAHVSKERQVTTTVIPIIEGNVGDRKCVAGQIPFTNLDPLTDGTLVPGNPDLYYGARPEQLDRKIRSELGGFIVPSTQHDLPVAPNFSLAVKGPDGSSAVAERQACYDGALQARGMQRLLSYGEPSPVYGNRAHAVTCTYLDGQIKMYTSHPVPSSNPRAKSEYVMTQINAYALTGNRDSFRQGVAAYRNARDWAKQQRDEAITQANNEVTDSTIATSASENNPALSFETDISVAETMTGDASQGASTPRNNAPSHDPDSDTSADDLSMDFVSKRAKIQSTTKESK